MKKIIGLLAILAVIFGIAGCGKKGEKKEVKKVGKANEVVIYKNVRTVNGNFGEIETVSESSGELESKNTVTEKTRIGGDLVKIYHKNGDKVKKGAKILELDNQEVKSGYYDAKARLASAKSNYLSQKSTFSKYKTLYKEKLISEDEYTNYKNQYIAAQGSYNSAQAGYKRAAKNFKDQVVRAKINGTLANLDLKKYSNIALNTPLFTIVDNKNLRIVISVPSKVVLTLKRGREAKVYVEGENKPLLGKVTEINPIANKGDRKFKVKIELSNKEGKYRVGMFTKVLLDTGTIKGVQVPKSAIIIEELSTYLFIASKEKKKVDGKEKEVLIARKIKVELGESNNDMQEVKSELLKDKNRIVVMGQYSLNDGDYIKEME